eukprot:gene21493-28472_t
MRWNSMLLLLMNLAACSYIGIASSSETRGLTSAKALEGADRDLYSGSISGRSLLQGITPDGSFPYSSCENEQSNSQYRLFFYSGLAPGTNEFCWEIGHEPVLGCPGNAAQGCCSRPLNRIDMEISE